MAYILPLCNSIISLHIDKPKPGIFLDGSVVYNGSNIFSNSLLSTPLPLSLIVNNTSSPLFKAYIVITKLLSVLCFILLVIILLNTLFILALSINILELDELLFITNLIFFSLSSSK